MSAFASIDYRDFWDYPRIFLVRHGGRLFLFDCEFDEETEDFRDDYKIYLMPEIFREDRQGSWVDFPRRAIRYLCSLPAQSIPFADPEKKSIDASILDNLTREPARRTG
jgi:hypothetical protein